ncbi:MAG: hypothetical protein ACD_62C00055G0003 [uncultured bacterium]|nr:MAG: hypothetical protein ACD_62C00055G0003 [uncultured bacterium]
MTKSEALKEIDGWKKISHRLMKDLKELDFYGKHTNEREPTT